MFANLNRNLLKAVMLADGAFSLVAGAGLVALAGPIAGLLGVSVDPAIVSSVGLFLLGWGVFHLAAGRPAQPRAGAIGIAIAGDGLWVLASAAILFVAREQLSTIGMAAIALVALAVLDIMLLKLAGWRRQAGA
jgi:hypothetical protein